MTDDSAGGEVRSGPKYMSKPDMGRNLPKRFYKDAAVIAVDGGFTVELDGRRIKTPAKAEFYVVCETLAHEIADEWRAQDEHIDPETMLLTKLAHTSLDRVKGREDEIVKEVVSYLSSDLLCYRAESPRELVEKQQQIWDPIMKRAGDELGIVLKTASGIIHEEQPEASLTAAGEHLAGYSVFELCALHNITTMLGSGLLAIAHANEFMSLEDIWAAAHVDEDWQIERWGEDEEAQRRRSFRHEEMKATSRFLKLNQSIS